MKWAVEHLGLAAREPETLKAWYVETLGGRLLVEVPGETPAAFVELPGGLVIELYRASKDLLEKDDNKLQGLRHLALRVDSIESARAELETRGVAFPDPPRPAGGAGRIQFFRDPEGNLIHLVERPSSLGDLHRHF